MNVFEKKFLSKNKVQLDAKQIQRIWELAKHTEEMFYNRLNFFVITESLFIAAFVAIISGSQPGNPLLWALLVYGILLTYVWFQTQRGIKNNFYLLKQILEKILPEYKAIVDSRKDDPKGINTLTYLVPLLFFSLWIIILLYFLSSHMQFFVNFLKNNSHLK